MSAPFAAIEARINAAALAALSNASSTIDGVVVAGMFDNEYQDSFGLIDGTHPVFVTGSSGVTSSSVGDLITVGGVSYSIGRVEPDGMGSTGMTRLILERR